MSDLLAIAAPMKWSQIEDVAIRATKQYAPDVLSAPRAFPIDELIRFDLERFTGAVYGVSELGENIEAVTIFTGQRLEVLFNDATDLALERGDWRARMTAAHELAHVIFHAELIRKAGGNVIPPGLFRKKSEVRPFENPERQASVFAGRLLVPTSALRLAIQSFGLDERQLADTFQVSPRAVDIRLREIGYR